jgi:hypothetical protein
MRSGVFDPVPEVKGKFRTSTAQVQLKVFSKFGEGNHDWDIRCRSFLLKCQVERDRVFLYLTIAKSSRLQILGPVTKDSMAALSARSVLILKSTLVFVKELYVISPVFRGSTMIMVLTIAVLDGVVQDKRNLDLDF